MADIRQMPTDTLPIQARPSLGLALLAACAVLTVAAVAALSAALSPLGAAAGAGLASLVLATAQVARQTNFLSINAATAGIDADLASATAQNNGSIDQLQLARVIADIKRGHEGVAERLAGALSQLQGQDVMRQRVEAVQQGLQELQQHLQDMAGLLQGGAHLPALKPLQLRPQKQATRHVMHSQRRTHARITGDRGTGASADAGAQRVELF